MALPLVTAQPDVLLMEIVVAARRLLAMQARVSTAAVPESLADAIERDFALFDLQEAASELRQAVEAAEVVALGEVPSTWRMELLPSMAEG